MKKLITLIAVALFATASFAQEKAEKSADMKASEKMKHECYAMKDGALMHCMGTSAEPQKAAVTLSNGTVISPDGAVKMKDGQESKMENGQCISMMGSIGDCGDMHASMPKEHGDQMKKEEGKSK
jgi:hypothetical protein